MRFLRRLLPTAAALALLLTAAAVPRMAQADTPLHDLKGHWSEAIVRRAIDLGIVSGYPDNTFRPDRPISRAEYIKMLVTAGHLTAQGSGVPFSDMETHWLQTSGFLAPAWSTGVVSPYDYKDGLYPDAPIGRQEMAVLAERLLGRITLAQQLEGAALPLADSDAVAPWARGYIKLALQDKILAGYPDNTFRPDRGATRAEAVSVILRTQDAMITGLDPGLKLIAGGRPVSPGAPLALAVRDGYVFAPARYVYGDYKGIKTYSSLTEQSALDFFLRPGNDTFGYAELPQLQIPVGSNRWLYHDLKQTPSPAEGTLMAFSYRLYGELMIPVAKAGGDGTLPFAKAHHDAARQTVTIELQPDWPGNRLPATPSEAKLGFFWPPPSELAPGAQFSLPQLAAYDSTGRRIEPTAPLQVSYHTDPSGPLRLTLSTDPQPRTDLTIFPGSQGQAYVTIADDAAEGTYTVTAGAAGYPGSLTWNLKVTDNRPYKLAMDPIPASRVGQPQTITVRLYDRFDRQLTGSYRFSLGPKLTVTMPNGSTAEATADETMDTMDHTMYMDHGVATYRFTPRTAGTYTYTATMNYPIDNRTIQPATASATIAP